jgi:hypothetical protein
MGVFAAPAENQGPWFTHQYDQDFGLDGELPLVGMLKGLRTRVRADGPAPGQWEKPDYEVWMGQAWDHRLKYLGVTLDRAQGSGPHWRVVLAEWMDEDEVEGAGYLFVQALDTEGNPIERCRFRVSRCDAADTAETKGEIDGYWGNYRMGGLLGTYDVDVVDGQLPSDLVRGVGLGIEDDHRQVSRSAFRFVFQLTV